MRNRKTNRKAQPRWTKLSREHITAWFVSVINPVVAALEAEQAFLRNKNWTWRHQWRRLELIKPIKDYIEPILLPNFEHFVAFQAKPKTAMDQHDDIAVQLTQACALLQSSLEGLEECKKSYQITILGDDKALIEEWFHGIDAADRFPLVVQQIVNDVTTLPKYHPLCEYWKEFGQTYLAYQKHAQTKSVWEQTLSIGTRLRETDENLQKMLKDIRMKLAQEYGVPPAPITAPDDEAFGVLSGHGNHVLVPILTPTAHGSERR